LTEVIRYQVDPELLVPAQFVLQLLPVTLPF